MNNTKTTIAKTGSPSMMSSAKPSMMTSPTMMPVASSSSSSDGYGGGSAGATCFAGSEIITMESGESKFISEVRVGDRVLAADIFGKTRFSDVIFVPHGTNTRTAVFAHITTAEGRDIKMTQNHVVPAGECGSSATMPLVYASAVQVGNCIMTVSGEERVVMNEKFRSQGVYTIVTNEEYVVVNGIIASSFGINHMMANMYYNIHRALYSFAPALMSFTVLQNANEVRNENIKQMTFVAFCV